eukprot:gene15444-17023_t
MATNEVEKIVTSLKELFNTAPSVHIYTAIGVLILTTCKLLEKRKSMTHTSIRENKGQYLLSKENAGKRLVVIDLPGHERIRGQYIKKYEENTRGILFLVDSATFPKQARDIAEFLYDIFASKVWRKTKPPILVVCNKQDLPVAKSCNVIKTQLEKELNNLRKTRAAALKGTDDSNSPENVDIGKKGKDFSFNNLHSKIEFIECQLKDGDASNLADIENWLKKIG